MSIFENLEDYNSPLIKDKQDAMVFDSDNPQEVYFSKIAKAGFNLDEIVPILKTKGHQLVISGAGSGKTTAMVFEIQNDIITGEAMKMVALNNSTPVRVVGNLLVCTFSNSATAVLKERLSYWQRAMGYNNTSESVKFKTLHKEFMDTLKRIGCIINIIPFEKSREITRKLCTRYHISNQNTGYLSKEDYKDIESIFTLARNRLDGKGYSHEKCDLYGITPTILDAMLYDAKEERRALKYVDFEDTQEILYDALRTNKKLQEYVAQSYDIIYIDEFQDTSQIQYEILKYYFAGAKKVVAIGDDDQTIYTWRGSDIEIIRSRFPQDFKPTIQKLTTNYRCPSNILNPVIPSIVKNQNRYYKELKSYNEGGELKIIADTQVSSFANRMLLEIVDDMRCGYNVAILTRTNYDGLIPAFLLEVQHKFNYSLSSDLMTANSALPRSIVDLCSIFLDRSSPRLKTSLEMLVSRQAKYQIAELCNVLKMNGNLNLWTIPINDLRYSVPELAEVLRMLREVNETAGEMESFKRLLNFVKVFNFNNDSEYSKGARNFIDLLFIIINIKNYSTVEEFSEGFRLLNRAVSAHVDVNARDIKINICTVHDAKGNEWDSVYIWNDTEGVFPNEKSLEDIEEERRLHYIAWTRAKKKLTVLTQVGSEGMFLQECDVPKSAINTEIRLKL